jgi:transcriptional regulator with XRE-family HTH domain
MSSTALAAHLHITRQQLYLIERNKTPNPGALTVAAMADIFGVSTDYLLGRCAQDVVVCPIPARLTLVIPPPDAYTQTDATPLVRALSPLPDKDYW